MGLFDGVHRSRAYNNIINLLAGQSKIVSPDKRISPDNEVLIRQHIERAKLDSSKTRAALEKLIKGKLITPPAGDAQPNFELIMGIVNVLRDIGFVTDTLILLNGAGLLNNAELAVRNRSAIKLFEENHKASELLRELRQLGNVGFLKTDNQFAQQYFDLATSKIENFAERTKFLIANKDNGKSAAIATLSSLGYTEALLASFEKWSALAAIFSDLRSSLFTDGNEHAEEYLTALIATSTEKLESMAVICDRLKDTPVFSATNPKARDNFIRLLAETTNSSALVASLDNANIVDLLSTSDSSQNCFETILSPDENSVGLTRLLDENRAIAGRILSVYINLKVKNFFAEESAKQFEVFSNAAVNIEAINVILKKLDSSWILNLDNPNAVANITTIIQNHAALASLNTIIDSGALPVLLDPAVTSEQQQLYFNGLFANTQKFSDIENIVTVIQGKSIFSESGSVDIARAFIDAITSPAYDTANLLAVIRLLNPTLVFTGEGARENFRKILLSGAIPATLLGYLQNDDVKTLLSNPQVAQRFFDLLVNFGEVAVRLGGVLAANSGDVENIINLYNTLETLGYFQDAELDSKFELFQAAVFRVVQINQLLAAFKQSNLIGGSIASTHKNINVILRMPVIGFTVLQQLRFPNSAQATKYLDMLPKSEEQLGYLNTVLSNLPDGLAAGTSLRVVEQRTNFELLSAVFADAEIKVLLANADFGQACFDILLASSAQIEQTAAILKSNREDLPAVLAIYKDFEGCGIDKINALLGGRANLQDLFKLISLPAVQDLIEKGNKEEIIGLLTNAADSWSNLHLLFIYLSENTDLLTADNIFQILEIHHLSLNVLTVMRNYKEAPVFSKGSALDRANKSFQVILQMDEKLKMLSDAQAELARIDRLNGHNIYILTAAVKNGWDLPAVVRVFRELPVREDGHTAITYIFSILLGLPDYSQEEFFALAAVIIDKNLGADLIGILEKLKAQGLLNNPENARQICKVLLAYNDVEYRDLSLNFGQFMTHLNKFLKIKFPDSPDSPDLPNVKISILTLIAKSGPNSSAMVAKFTRENSEESMQQYENISQIIESLYKCYRSFYKDRLAALSGARQGRDAIVCPAGSDGGFAGGSVKSGMHFMQARSSIGGGSLASAGSRITQHGSAIVRMIGVESVSEARYFIEVTCEQEISGRLRNLSDIRKPQRYGADEFDLDGIDPSSTAGLH